MGFFLRVKQGEAMKVFHSMDTGDFLNMGALAIGNFDGVHLGHQALLKKTSLLKGQAHAGVLTFTPHPHELLFPDTPHFYLSSDAQKEELFTMLGLDAAIFQPVDQEFLLLSPEQFVDDLVNRLKIKHVVVGADFTFGQKALGTAELLTTLGARLGFSTHIIEKISVDGMACSSSAIRNLLRNGDIKTANRLLDRPFSLRGKVVLGQQQGQHLGFPTANIIPKNFFLKHGVYASITRIKTGEGLKDELSITNVGIRPTISDSNTLIVESHALSGSFDLYGQEIEIFFLERIRDEQKFPTILALQEQVKLDCLKVRQMKEAVLLKPLLE